MGLITYCDFVFCDQKAVIGGGGGGGWGLDLCELENALETQKCPKAFVHDCS